MSGRGDMPAYPTPGDAFGEYSASMTLRQFYAAMALTGLVANPRREHPKATARTAFEYADAMLKVEGE